MNRPPVGAPGRPLKVLLVEDCEADAVLVMAELRRRGYAPTWRRIETAGAMREALAEETWDCVLSDFELPRFGGLEALRIVQESDLDVPFIVISGTIGEETAVGVMKAGAHDYVMKDSLSRLCPALERELREVEVRRERRRAAAALAEDTAVISALQRVSQTLITSLAAPDLLTALCQVTAEVLDCDSSHTLFWQPEADVFRPIANHGATPREQAIARAVAVPRATMVELIERLAANDVAEVDPTPIDLLATPRGLASRQLCVALRCGTELIGIQVASRRDSLAPFDNRQLRIGRGIAQLASLTLEHARVRQELEQSNRLKADFVATMSHELRTPLNIIMGYTELLLDDSVGDGAEQRYALKAIDRNARDLLEMINATLDLSRLERGLAPLDVETIRLGDFLREILASARENGTKPAVQVLADIPADLPTLRTDPIKLKVILRNLMTNALKFTDAGTITLTARAVDLGVEICVADTGSGIDPDVLPTIFEPFRQGGNAATASVTGVGLGLYIVRKLLDLLLGTINVESVLGEGSTFRVTLPRQLDGAQWNKPVRALAPDPCG